MFTGIIREIGRVEKVKKEKGSFFLAIFKPKKFKVKRGDSVAANGVCLTVQKILGKSCIFEIMPETLKKTYFGKVKLEIVNLEPSLRLSDRLDGHLVLGHIDTVGKIKSIKAEGRSKVYTFSFPKKFSKLTAGKGSAAIDGVSLTTINVKPGEFSVALISYTIKNTVLGKKKVGDLVNIEFDIAAKYLQKLI